MLRAALVATPRPTAPMAEPPKAELPRRARPGSERSRQRPAERARRADPARRAAYTLLRAVDGGAYANLELPKILRAQRLSGRDAAFATELAYGAIRLRGRYDPIIAVAADRPLSAIDAAVLDTLRLGAHQVLAMRVPAHAAVAETVGLARQVNGAGAAGFVNAVLRRVGERSLTQWLDLVAPAEGAAHPSQEALAVRESHPLWIVKAFEAALLGHAAADRQSVQEQLRQLLAADNSSPRVALAARPGLAEVGELLAAGADPGRWAPTAAVLPGGDPGSLPAVREGRAAVQDEGSQLVALALAAAPVAPVAPVAPGARGAAAVAARTGRPADEPEPQERWLDLCAGPGGKAGLLAALAAQHGVQLVANEISEHRADLVRGTLAAVQRAARDQGRPVPEVRVGDGREAGELEPAAYDRVLVDAPCTGLGALRRRPEARWRRTPADLAVLSRLQRELLAGALDAARVGGVVAYVTCSPHLAETVFAVDDVLRRRSDVERLDARAVLVQVAPLLDAQLGPGPLVQLWPHRHGTDGMFRALLRRR